MEREKGGMQKIIWKAKNEKWTPKRRAKISWNDPFSQPFLSTNRLTYIIFQPPAHIRKSHISTWRKGRVLKYSLNIIVPLCETRCRARGETYCRGPWRHIKAQPMTHVTKYCDDTSASGRCAVPVRVCTTRYAIRHSNLMPHETKYIYSKSLYVT